MNRQKVTDAAMDTHPPYLFCMPRNEASISHDGSSLPICGDLDIRNFACLETGMDHKLIHNNLWRSKAGSLYIENGDRLVKPISTANGSSNDIRYFGIPSSETRKLIPNFKTKQKSYQFAIDSEPNRLSEICNVRDCNLRLSVEPPLVHPKRCGLEQILKLNATSWGTDCDSGFNIYREVQTLLIERAKAKTRNVAIATLQDSTAKENEELRASLESLVLKLRCCHLMVNRFQARDKTQKHKEVASQILETRIRELEEIIRITMEKLIEEQKQREIDGIKSTMLFDGLQRRFEMQFKKLKELHTQNTSLGGDLKKRLEECEKEKRNLEKNLQDKEHELHQSKEGSSKLKTKVGQLNGELYSLTEHIHQLTNQIGALKSLAAAKDLEIISLGGQLQGVEQKGERAVERQRLAEDALVEKENERRAVEIELYRLKLKVAELTALLENKDQSWIPKLETLESQKKELDKKLIGLQNESNEIKRENGVLKEKINELIEKDERMKEQVAISMLNSALNQQHPKQGGDKDKDGENTLTQQLESLNQELANERVKNQKLENQLKVLYNNEDKQKSHTITKNRTVVIDISALPRLLSKNDFSVRVEYLPQPLLLDTHRIPPVIKQPTMSILSPKQVQNVYLARELFPPTRIEILQPVPKDIGRQGKQLSPTQARLILGTEAASAELLTRKPSANELAAVAVTGTQQRQRLFAGTPTGRN